MDALILIIPLLVYFGTSIVIELGKRFKKNATTDDLPQGYDARLFPTLSPKSDSHDDVVAHKRDVQRYLMDAWEQRMEEEVGATSFRSFYFQAKELADHHKKKKVYELANLGSRSTDRMYSSNYHFFAKRAEEQYPHSADKIKKTHDPIIQRWERKQAEAKEEYNRRMNRPLDAELPNYQYSGLTTYLPSATLNEVNAIEPPKEDEPPQTVYDVNRERRRLVAEVVEAEDVDANVDYLIQAHRDYSRILERQGR